MVDPTNGKEYLQLDLKNIKQMDANGEIPRDLVNPWYKDTVTVQAKGGYVIIRFKADNPGTRTILYQFTKLTPFRPEVLSTALNNWLGGLFKEFINNSQ